MVELKIDSEFRDLIPPLSEEERAQLEENILHEGIRDPLVVWNGIIVDGHNRYQLAQKHGLTFETTEMDFADRDAVKVWIIKNQLGRRNLSAYDRSLLALKLKPVIAAQAKEKQGERTDLNIPQIFAESKEDTVPTFTLQEQKKIENDRETNAQVAQAAGVSRETIRKVEKIEAQATPEIKAALRTGDLSINAAYEGVKAGATTVEEVKEVKENKIPILQNSGNNERYTPAEYIEAAREVLGEIDLDPASSALANETVKAKKFYTKEEDGLAHDWFGNVWLNPPYAKDLLPRFAEKFAASNFNQAIVLVHNATETRWFLNFIGKASAVVFPTGRVDCKTPGENRNSPLQGSAIIYAGPNAEKFLEVFSRFGWRATL